MYLSLRETLSWNKSPPQKCKECDRVLDWRDNGALSIKPDYVTYVHGCCMGDCFKQNQQKHKSKNVKSLCGNDACKKSVEPDKGHTQFTITYCSEECFGALVSRKKDEKRAAIDSITVVFGKVSFMDAGGTKRIIPDAYNGVSLSVPLGRKNYVTLFLRNELEFHRQRQCDLCGKEFDWRVDGLLSDEVGRKMYYQSYCAGECVKVAITAPKKILRSANVICHYCGKRIKEDGGFTAENSHIYCDEYCREKKMMISSFHADKVCF
jgi:hypothetical protein